MRKKKICFFGIFNQEYARNRVLIEGFRRNGYEVYICRIDPRAYGVLRKYWELYREYKKYRQFTFDHVIVAFPGHTVVWLAYLLMGRNFIFDVFISLYNSEVEDRAYHRIISLRAMYYWCLDWFSMRLPKTLMMETDEHIEFLVRKFGVKKDKFIKVYVGSDYEVVYPKDVKKSRNKFLVVFHGTGIPLQGIPYIVDAAEVLREDTDIFFLLHGEKNNFVFKEAQKMVQKKGLMNIEFVGAFDHGNINNVIGEADIMLGIFGDTQKTQFVIPNKVYESWASRKPVITARTPAMEELVTSGEQALLCNIADGYDLAKKIIILKNDIELRENISDKGYSLYKMQLTPEVLVKNLIEDLEN